MSGVPILVIQVIGLFTLFATGISGYYMYRQRTTSYNDARNLIVAVHIFFGGTISLEIARASFGTDLFLRLYVVLGTIFILLCVELLTMLAWSVYLPIRKTGIRNLLSGISRNRLHFMIFAAGSAYITFVITYLVVGSPYSFQSAPILTNQFNPIFLALLFSVLIMFMTYPTTLFIGARRKTTLPNVKTALVLLPIAWIGIGLDLLIFNAFPNPAGIDLLPIGYLIAALGLAATSTIFRRASLLAGFFESRKADSMDKIPVAQPQATKASSKPFSKQLGLGEDAFSGRKFLLEVDSSTSYERVVNDFVTELSNIDYSVFVFTTRGSPIYNSLRSSPSRFYLLSTTVSYTTVSAIPTEVLVPQSDPAVLLDAMQKTIETDSITPIGIVFDSVSDFIMSLGLETSYKFLKKTLEAIDSDRITALFLMTSGAHEDRQTSLVKSLFSNQIKFGAKGLEANRLA
ncbi:MAG: hypothetical protein PXY39_03620 [archaeon]|nr:hypothetical protein [archaeon]